MNKFEQGYLEKKTEDNPNHLLERVDSFTVPKVKRILDELQGIEHPTLESKLERLIKKTEEKFGVNVSRESLIKKALEDISVENGMLSEKLMDAYVSILVDSILEKTGDNENIHSEIELELERLRGGGVYIDEERVREKVSEAYYERQKADEVYELDGEDKFGGGDFKED